MRENTDEKKALASYTKIYCISPRGRIWTFLNFFSFCFYFFLISPEWTCVTSIIERVTVVLKKMYRLVYVTGNSWFSAPKIKGFPVLYSVEQSKENFLFFYAWRLTTGKKLPQLSFDVKAPFLSCHLPHIFYKIWGP